MLFLEFSRILNYTPSLFINSHSASGIAAAPQLIALKDDLSSYRGRPTNQCTTTLSSHRTDYNA
jgi:hypothetical protein